MALDTRFLEDFLAVVQHGSFKAAAEVSGQTAQRLSYQINRLESRLQQPLFQRSVRGVQLTDYGKRFHQFVAPRLQALLKQEAPIRACQQPQPLVSWGQVHVAQALAWPFQGLIADFVRMCRNQPGSWVPCISSAPAQQIEDHMLRYAQPLGLSHAPSYRPDFSSECLGTSEYVIVGQPQDTKAWHELRYIGLQQRQEPPAHFPTLPVILTVSEPHTALQLCEKGLGALCVPYLTVRELLRRQRLQIIAELPERHSISLYMLQSQATPLTGRLQHSMRLLRESVSRHL
ncbi:MAG: LysR family transcriptional regulator [Candidatus Sericytochromatia bacterium]